MARTLSTTPRNRTKGALSRQSDTVSDAPEDTPSRHGDLERGGPARILVVDDNASLLEVFRKILSGDTEIAAEPLASLEAVLFATQPERLERPTFLVDGVRDGEQGRNCVLQACSEGRPYAVAFVDMRMPGGWDGLKTIEELWRADPEIQVVICTAYADYSWDDITARLGRSDRLLILRKPFEKIEVLQLAIALSDKWWLNRERNARLVDLEQRVEERTRHLQLALSERERAERELAQFFTLTTDILCVIGLDGCLKQFNPALQKILGYSAEELQDLPFAEILHPEGNVFAEIQKLALQTGKQSGLETRCRTRDGAYRWIEWDFVAAENHSVLYCTGRDITGRQEAEQTRKRLAAVLEGTVDIIFFADPQWQVLYLNRTGRELFPVHQEEDIGRSAYDFYPPWASEIIRNQGLPTAVRQGTWRGETAVICADGREVPVSQVIEAHRTPAGEMEFFSTILRDIGDRKSYEAQLQYQATHDPLTGLPNRTLLADRLKQAMSYAQRYDRRVTVVVIDLDNFKWINDSLSHMIGDELLKTMAQRMADCIRRTDTVSRLGGDEFVIILFDQPKKTETIAPAIQKIQASIAQPVHLAGHELQVGCSIGLSTYPGDGQDADTLLKNADAAMYHAKEIGGNNFQFFTAEMNIRIQERLALQEGLRNAIERKEFVLLYQPQIDLKSGRLVGVEALIRWQHPDLGMIAPGSFIALAEETGLIVPIGDWALQTACKQNKAWQDAGRSPLRMSVNVSARQFREKDLINRVAHALQESGLEAKYLELELTESLLVQDVQEAIATMRELNAMGVQLSIDDFGTGYSSLSYLKRFPVGRLKIDQSFVRGIPADRDDQAIAKAVISLGHRMNLKVIAEGVETEKQLAFLRDNNCDEMQGYYFSEPVSVQEFEKFFDAPAQNG